MHSKEMSFSFILNNIQQNAKRYTFTKSYFSFLFEVFEVKSWKNMYLLPNLLNMKTILSMQFKVDCLMSVFQV